MRGEDLLFQASRSNRRPIPANVRFVDLNPDYGLNDHALLTNEHTSLRLQMKQLLSTPVGSEEHEPTYGSNLPYRIMEPINRVNAFLLRADTLDALTTWMSNRLIVSINLFQIVPLVSADGYHISIPYASVATHAVDQFQFEVLR